MKKLLALLLALCMVFALCACSGSDGTAAAGDETEEAETATEDAEAATEEDAAEEEPADEYVAPDPLVLDPIDPADLMVGLICVEDENSGYDEAHIAGVQEACAALGIPEENIMIRKNISESEECYDACVELAEAGCQIVITDSYGHQSFCEQAAAEFPEVNFVSMTGDLAHYSGMNNYKNAFCYTYQSRYVSGVVAGMKLQEMIDNDELTDANYDEDGNVKLGYVGAYPYAEVVSGYTAFYLGVKSIVENVAMDVRFTNSWYDPIAEASAAAALIADGCCILSQHADSTGAPSEVEAEAENGALVYDVGYNISMLSVAPTTSLTSASNDWSVYYTYALGQLINGEGIATDWAAGYADGANLITELGDACAEGTADKVAEVEAALADGTLNVFDCSTFTVDGETIDSYPITDFTTGNVLGEAVVDGVFQESVLRAAPYFDLQIDGITQLIEE